MLESQKMMMLDSAVAFEDTIKNPKPGVKGKGSKVQVFRIINVVSRWEGYKFRISVTE